MGLRDILGRVDERLKALNLSDAAAQKVAGAPGAIANMRVSVKKGTGVGLSTATLMALAPVLKARPCWLLTGEGPVNEEDAGGLAVRTDCDEDAFLTARNKLATVHLALQALAGDNDSLLSVERVLAEALRDLSRGLKLNA